MANKKINELDLKSLVTLTDLMIVGDPGTGTSYKTTLQTLQTIIASGVISFNGRIGAVVPANGDYSISSLSDILLTSLSNGQILQYDSVAAKWKNVPVPATGITSLGGQTGATQLLLTGTAGTQFNIVSSGNTHTFNIPIASGTNTGLLSNTDWTTFNSKQGAISLTTTGNSGAATFTSGTLNIPNYTLAGLGGISLSSLSAVSPLIYNNTTGEFSIQVANSTQNGYLSSTDWNTFNSKGSGTVTSVSVVSANGFTGTVANAGTTPAITLTTTITGLLKGNGTAMSSAVANTDYQSPINLTTTGSSGAATFNGTTLNIPIYGSGSMNNPMTTLGDIIVGDTGGTPIRLAGNTLAAKRFLTQTGTGSASAIPTWSTIAASDIASGQALTQVDDTNVTLTLGGTPSTALLQSVSLTLGWTGQLAISRGGTGLSALGTQGQLLRVNTGATALEYFTPNYLSIAIQSINGQTGSTQAFANDTNVTITSATDTHTIGWNGTLAVSRGGIGVGTLTGFAIGNGTSAFTSVPLANVAYFGSAITGTANSSTYLRGDGSWQTISTGATGDMNSAFNSGTGGTNIGTGETSIGTVTITPQNSGSKIQVIARMNATKDTGTTRRTVTVRIKRGSVQVGQDCIIYSQNVASTLFGPAVINVIDLHGQSSAITYTIFALCDNNNGATSEKFSISAVELIGVKGDPGTGVSDGDKGDITISSSGTVYTIDNSAVTFAKIQNISANTFLGNPTGASGIIQEISTSRIPLFSSAITGTPSSSNYLRGDGSWQTISGVTDGDKGDITVSNNGLTWTIDPGAVIYADIQNVAANSFLANVTGTAATVQEISTNRIPLFSTAITGTPSTTTYLRGDGTWSTVSAGTVTSVSVVSANGFAGTVANNTTTPAITLTTTITGLLKGNGTAISAAISNTDFQAPITLTTTGTSGVATFNGTTLNIPNYGASSGMSNPMTALGDIIYGDTGGTPTRLAGNITTTKQFLSQTGTGSVSAAPSWATLTKSDVGLSNVENTALSTWAGSTNITTLGTVATGTWNATTIAINKGGTGLSALGTANQLLRVNSGATALEYFTPTYLTAAITSLGGQTGATQTFATGTTGTDFNISSVTNVHTFNIPDASATARGLITTGTQTIAGAKTFSSKLTVSSGGIAITGNSGFGTSSPKAELQMGARTTFFTTTSVNANIGLNVWFDGTNFKRVAAANAASLIQMLQSNTLNYYQSTDAGTTADSNITFAERFQVAAGGNFLIGTSTDGGFKLDVGGTARIQGALTVSTGGASITGNSTITGTTTSTGNLTVGSTTSVGNVFYQQYSSAETWHRLFTFGQSNANYALTSFIYGSSSTAFENNYSYIGLNNYYDTNAYRGGAISFDMRAGVNPIRIYTKAANSNPAERVSIASTGQVQFHNYTTTTSFSGTVVGLIGFDANGNLLTTSAGSGTVTSVAFTSPTNMSVTGSPITSNGTLALTFNSGFQAEDSTENEFALISSFKTLYNY